MKKHLLLALDAFDNSKWASGIAMIVGGSALICSIYFSAWGSDPRPQYNSKEVNVIEPQPSSIIVPNTAPTTELNTVDNSQKQVIPIDKEITAQKIIHAYDTSKVSCKDLSTSNIIDNLVLCNPNKDDYNDCELKNEAVKAAHASGDNECKKRYEKITHSADSIYKNKRLRITGIVDKSFKSGTDSAILVLRANKKINWETESGRIYCNFVDHTPLQQLEGFGSGDQITLDCTCNGFNDVEMIDMQQCELFPLSTASTSQVKIGSSVNEIYSIFQSAGEFNSEFGKVPPYKGTIYIIHGKIEWIRNLKSPNTLGETMAVGLLSEEIQELGSEFKQPKITAWIQHKQNGQMSKFHENSIITLQCEGFNFLFDRPILVNCILK